MLSRSKRISTTIILLIGLLGLSCPKLQAKTTPKANHPAIKNFDRVGQNVYRGATPANEKAIRELSKMGIKSIINLRSSYFSVKREKRLAEKYGIKFFHIPMGYFNPSNEKASQILKVMTAPENQPVFVHCRYGSDRTGMVIGLYRTIFQDWSFKRAYKEMRLHHFKPWLAGLRAKVKRGKSNPTLLAVRNEIRSHSVQEMVVDVSPKKTPASM